MATLLLIAKVLSRKTKQNYGRLCFLVCIAASNLSMEEIEEGLCRERERERERDRLAMEGECIIFLVLKTSMECIK